MTPEAIIILTRIAEALEEQSEVQKQWIDNQKVWFDIQKQWREENRAMDLERHAKLMISEEKNQKLLDIRLKQEEEYAESRKKWNTKHPVTEMPTIGDKI